MTIRGQRVMLAGDLARVYGVQTHFLNQAVGRHAARFPSDFMFRTTIVEAKAVQRSSSPDVILKRGCNLKYRPYASTEHGAIMAATILNRPGAVQMSVFVVRAFLRMPHTLASHSELGRRLDALEKRYNAQFKVVFDAIRQLMAPPDKARRSIGFRVEAPAPRYRLQRDPRTTN